MTTCCPQKIRRNQQAMPSRQGRNRQAIFSSLVLPIGYGMQRRPLHTNCKRLRLGPKVADKSEDPTKRKCAARVSEGRRFWGLSWNNNTPNDREIISSRVRINLEYITTAPQGFRVLPYLSNFHYYDEEEHRQMRNLKILRNQRLDAFEHYLYFRNTFIVPQKVVGRILEYFNCFDFCYLSGRQYKTVSRSEKCPKNNFQFSLPD